MDFFADHGVTRSWFSPNCSLGRKIGSGVPPAGSLVAVGPGVRVRVGPGLVAVRVGARVGDGPAVPVAVGVRVGVAVRAVGEGGATVREGVGEGPAVAVAVGGGGSPTFGPS